MLQFFAKILARLAALKYRRRIEEALALHHRGEVRRDGLKLISCSTRLEVEWYARDIHPWDRADPDGKRGSLFVRQSIVDTEGAIGRLFRLLPEIDAIEVIIREQGSDHVIMAGTVHRSAPIPDTNLSLGMQLRQRGLKYYSDGLRFEPLSSIEEPYYP